jgi:hypothetical protein
MYGNVIIILIYHHQRNIDLIRNIFIFLFMMQIAIHGSIGLNFLLLEKASAVADCLENQFTPHYLCVEVHSWQVEATVQALLEAIEDPPPLLKEKDHVTYKN